MSKICLITGNHPRHKHFAKKLISTDKVCAWVIQDRKNLVPMTPKNLQQDTKILFEHHFRERERVESEVFANSIRAEKEIKIPTHNVSRSSLNSDQTVNFLKKYSPSLVISYGCTKITENFMKEVASRFWNTHGGLSPQYRGVITHFWPSYFLEPQMTGMTLHETTNFLDAGEIIFQTAAPMVTGDTLHRLAARNIEIFAEQLASKIVKFDFDNLPRGKIQKGYGKVFKSEDWRPEHLRIIYDLYNDSIVDLCIKGEIKGREPELISVL